MSETNEIEEVDAMKQIGTALKGLDADAVRRVLTWANDRFGHKTSVGRQAVTLSGGANGDVGVDAPAAGASVGGLPADLADAYAAAAAETEADRALVVAAWIQFVRGDSDFDAQSVNKELKHLGDGVGNITKAFTSLMVQKPQLVIQTRKQGTSRQARKLYKVTAAGLKVVQSLIAKGSE